MEDTPVKRLSYKELSKLLLKRTIERDEYRSDRLELYTVIAGLEDQRDESLARVSKLTELLCQIGYKLDKVLATIDELTIDSDMYRAKALKYCCWQSRCNFRDVCEHPEGEYCEDVIKEVEDEDRGI